MIQSESCKKMEVSRSTKLDSRLGGSWKEKIDYEETLAPMAKYTLIMALATKSLGFETHDRQSHVYRWEKALYELKQVPRTWYGWIDSFLMSLDFTKSKVVSNLCDKIDDDDDAPIHRVLVDTRGS